MKEMTNMKT